MNIVPFDTIDIVFRYGLDRQQGRVLVGNVLGVALGYGLYRTVDLIAPRGPATQPAR